MSVVQTRVRIMKTVESQTKNAVGLDRITFWILVSGLAAVLIGAGIGMFFLLAGADSIFTMGAYWWWAVTGGALLCAIGGWRAARRWSSTDRNKASDAII